MLLISKGWLLSYPACLDYVFYRQVDKYTCSPSTFASKKKFSKEILVGAFALFYSYCDLTLLMEMYNSEQLCSELFDVVFRWGVNFVHHSLVGPEGFLHRISYRFKALSAPTIFSRMSAVGPRYANCTLFWGPTKN
jgi:hypothetical protein